MKETKGNPPARCDFPSPTGGRVYTQRVRRLGKIDPGVVARSAVFYLGMQ